MSLTNAKKEFLKHVTDLNKVIAAIVKFREKWSDTPQEYILQPGWTEKDLEVFLQGLDFEYDAGYGCQYLWGYIWYKDKSFSERKEYDGSEWWAHVKTPMLSDYFKTEQKGAV